MKPIGNHITVPLVALWALAAIEVAGADQAANKIGMQVSTERPCVILLHGLGRTYRSMNTMADALEKAGFTTFNIDYASRRQSIQALAMQVIPQALAQCGAGPGRTIHFVTHSMGGILVRYYLSRTCIEHLGRVVMLSPPNQGSEAADALKHSWYYKWYNGPAGLQLGTGPDGIAATLGPVTFPLGILTGNAPTLLDGRILAFIPGENDGKVSVQRAKVKGMTDFMVLPYSHTFIMNEKETIAQTIHFLHHATFKR